MVASCIFALSLINLNPQIQEMVNCTSPDSIISSVQRLQDFITRCPVHDSCFAAADWIQSKFLDIGLDSVYRDSFTWTYVVPPNIVGVKRGVLFPESCYSIICAHYDAYAPIAHPDTARGADDNGSGVAAVIETARVLSSYQFDYGIRFIAFSNEEFGSIGAEHYASNALLAGDDIMGVFNFDMIGYSDALPESVEVEADPFCEPLVDLYIACADTYTTLLTTKRIFMASGDAFPFSERGYQAITMVEDWPLTNPYFHWLAADTIGSGFNDLSFCTEVIRAGIASLATLAHPVGIVEKQDSEVVPWCVMRIAPNPFTTETDIRYQITDVGEYAHLEIFDASGRLVRSFSLLPSAVGHQSSVRWDGTDGVGRQLGNGVYFLKLRSENCSAAEKLLLIR
ncbi:MAG: M20/M25/M40 family metallo-hydrolase [candidate division WOR-3 bacterium]|nr:MAG: M20/M25/M40 family metallo-hydrolase [candidate division WOR-3 bacterium]